ncbi:hypothetical protein GCK32_003561, partial [Trichostrongylus colubriformis]
DKMWYIVVIVALVIIILLFLGYLLRRSCRSKKKKEEISHVSISFPLPPPTGESDEIMDETQYDVRVKALRDSKSKTDEIGSADMDGEPRDDRVVHPIATLFSEDKRRDSKVQEAKMKKK